MKISTTKNISANQSRKTHINFGKKNELIGLVQIKPKFEKEAQAIIEKYAGHYGRRTNLGAQCVKELCEIQGENPPYWVNQVLNRPKEFIYNAF